MNLFKKKHVTLAALICICIGAGAQTDLGGGVRIDKTVHDFGDVLISDGALECTFTVTNTGNKPLAIFTVNSSCGCTGVDWTREPIKPGKTGTIKAVYENADGPYPFEKTLTVYFSSISQPVVLRIKGVANKKELSLDEAYSIHAGHLGFKDLEIKAGNLRQGQKRSGEVTFANLGKGSAKVSFINLSPGLTVSATPNPVGGRSTAKVVWTIEADRSRWGKNHYYAEIAENGKGTGKKLDIWSLTGENFTGWTDEQKKNASLPEFTSSSFSLGHFKIGEKFTAVYDFKNAGKSDFVVYKVDCDSDNAVFNGSLPKIASGMNGRITIDVDTKGMPRGETLIIVSLTTNCPSRPLVNLFITGWAE